MVKEYNQVEEINYAKTFSPIIKPQIIKVVLIVAIFMNWPLK